MLFGKNPQKFFITSEVKCAHFHVVIVSKPIPSYQVYKGDVFVMNPGQLPYGLTVDKLYTTHSSLPSNPLIAEAMYLRGTIERMGTGTEDLANRCIAQGLKKPEYQQEIDFRATLYRDYEEETAGQVTGQVEKILLYLIINHFP